MATTVTLTSNGTGSRTATVVVSSDNIKITSNSKTQVIYTNEPVCRALMRYLAAVQDDFSLSNSKLT